MSGVTGSRLMDKRMELLVRFEIDLSKHIMTASNTFVYLFEVVLQCFLSIREQINQSYQFTLYIVVNEIALMTFLSIVQILLGVLRF